MKKTIVAFAPVLLLAGEVSAGERENAMSHIAQVVAITQLCSSVEMNSSMVTVLALAYDVDFTRDKTELLTQVQRQIAPWKNQPQELACAAGIILYGPDGQNVPGLLREK